MAVGYSLCDFSEILLYRFEELAFSFNGGKDSTVLSSCSHLLFIISSINLYIDLFTFMMVTNHRRNCVESTLDVQVLLHLLRAGYYLHRTSSDSTVHNGHVRFFYNPSFFGRNSVSTCFFSEANGAKTVKNCPMRTIYFENPNTFPEIDRFMYETAST